MNFARLRFFLLIAALLTLVSAMAHAQTIGGGVTFAITEEPDTLDPQKTSTAITGTILRYLGDTLITKDLAGDYIPGLAASWEVSDDGLTWSFVLKDGVLFHNGDPLTAAAVKASFERAVAPETQSPIAGSLFEPIESIEIVDDLTFRIILGRSFSPFLDNLTDPRAAVVNVQAASDMGDQFGRSPVLTGPWRMSDWRSGDRIMLERNPDYAWGPDYAQGGGPFLENLTFRVIPESATQVAAFEAGEVQVLSIPPTDVERLEQAGRYQIVDFLRKGVGLFLEFNVEKPPFDDPQVRTAMNYVIDKNVLVQVALQGLGEPAYGVLPPSIWGYWDEIETYAPDYDPERALELFAAAGWSRDAGGTMRNEAGEQFTFTLYSGPIDTWTRSAQVVQGQLADLGIGMEIQTFEFGTLLEKLRAGEQQADFMGYTYTSPDIVYLWFHSSNIGTGLAHSHFDDATLDGLIDASRTATDNTERLDLYRQIQQYIADQALWVPLWTNINYIAVQPDIQGVQIHPDGYLALLDAYLE